MSVILVPRIFESKIRERGHERHMLLFEMLQDRLGYKIQYKPFIQAVPDCETLISYGWEFRADSDLEKLIAEPKSKTKIVAFLYDPTWMHKALLPKYLERADLIVSPLKQFFERQYSEYAHKMLWLPNYFAPRERFCLPYNEKPLLKCLLPGQVLKYHPVRLKVLLAVHDNPELRPKVDILGHLRFPKKFYTREAVPYEDFGRVLNEYFCAITDSSHGTHDSVIAKYFEIPAAGALLLATRTQDLSDIGFVPYVHYVPVTLENVLERIETVLANPDEFEHIRKEGMEYVRANHGIEQRLEALQGILEEIKK